ncbi:MAG: GDP-L-fucose synthase [Alphaproteobacteria bacterium]|nr:GDP-L-fucose synthase [Alphaproteobacteria bacterium]
MTSGQPSITYALEGKRVWVAGHRGMVGSALVRRLQAEHCAEILTATRSELDLTQQASVLDWLCQEKPQAVFLPAAKVGGIYANDTYPAEFLYENLMIAANVIHASHAAGVEKLLFLGSSCIYPRDAAQPMSEEALLTGPLEPTNEWYAIAKIAGIKLCQAYRKQYGADFISAMPTNLYGPHDNYHPENSHVIPALLRKARLASEKGESDLEIWGSGSPLREFLYVDDCADALVFLMKHYSGNDFINVGAGSDVTIAELAKLVMQTAGLTGELRKDASKPDGAPRKLMSSERLLNMGWRAQTPLKDGLKLAYDWYLKTVTDA